MSPRQNDDNTLLASVPVNLGLLTIFVLLYFVLHLLFYPQFYKNPLKRGHGPPPPPGARYNPCAALWFSIRMSDDDYEHHAGLDALALIEFIRLSLRILLGYAAYGFTAGALSIWAALTYGSDSWGSRPLGALARISLTNLSPFSSDATSGEWDRWLGSLSSVLGCWYLSVLTIYQLNSSWQRVVHRRQRSLANAHDASSLAILVRSTRQPLPRVYSKEEALALWTSLYPGAIYDVRMVRETGRLPKLLAKRRALVGAIERLERRIERREATGRTRGGQLKTSLAATLTATWHGATGGGGDQRLARAHEALDRHESELQKLTAQMRDEYQAWTDPEHDRGYNYFVLFRRHRQCNIAKQVPTR